MHTPLVSPLLVYTQPDSELNISFRSNLANFVVNIHLIKRLVFSGKATHCISPIAIIHVRSSRSSVRRCRLAILHAVIAVCSHVFSRASDTMEAITFSFRVISLAWYARAKRKLAYISVSSAFKRSICPLTMFFWRWVQRKNFPPSSGVVFIASTHAQTDFGVS